MATREAAAGARQSTERRCRKAAAAQIKEAVRVAVEQHQHDELGDSALSSSDDDDVALPVNKKRKRGAAPALPEQVKLALRFASIGTSLRDTSRYMKYFNTALTNLSHKVSTLCFTFSLCLCLCHSHSALFIFLSLSLLSGGNA